MKIVRESLNEKVIDQDRLEIDIEYQIDTTKHSEERQSRHGEDDYISDEEISDNVHTGLHKLFNNILHYNVKNHTRVLIKNIDSDLNIVGAPSENEDGKVKFTIITVMREKNFLNPNNVAKLIEISDKDLKNHKYW